MHIRWLHVEVLLQAIYLLQIKSADDQKRTSDAGEGQLGVHMALSLAAGKGTSLLGFLAAPAEV